MAFERLASSNDLLKVGLRRVLNPALEVPEMCLGVVGQVDRDERDRALHSTGAYDRPRRSLQARLCLLLVGSEAIGQVLQIADGVTADDREPV